MPQLLINADDGTELLRVQIKKIDPATATIAILGALAKIEPEKKTRSDLGKKRPPKLELVNPATGERATIELPHVANGERSQVIP